MKLSSAGTVVGIEAPNRTTNLEVKPYVTAGLRTDLAAEEPFSNDLDQDVGFDVKYGVTRSLVFDFTYNTDFAQVEDDEQRVNLTRFSLFFPEKREFFLEGQGIFAFGGRQTSRFGGESNNTPIMFFSRRIGLSGATAVPIQAGGRLTGRAGAYTLGALAIRTDEVAVAGVPTTNFSVLRVKRDILRRSNIGVIATHRSASAIDDGTNSLFGLDANLSFYDNLNVNAYYSRSRTSALKGDDVSYLGRLDYGGDRYGLQLERLVVAKNFNPEIGFLRRTDFQRSFAKFRFSPRPQSISAVRKFSYEAGADYFTNGEGRLETREVELAFLTEFSNGDNFDMSYTRSFEFLDEPFEIADGVVVPVGEYRFQWLRYSYRLGPQRRMSGMLNFQHGSFFSGDRIELGYSGRVELTPQLSLEPALSFNWVDLPEGKFVASLARARVSYALSPRASFGALVQYNSANDSRYD